jgi:hypothetical protein
MKKNTKRRKEKRQAKATTERVETLLCSDSKKIKQTSSDQAEDSLLDKNDLLGMCVPPLNIGI